MHIISECPRCGEDFMYHSTDVQLERDITVVDEVGNNDIYTVVICQDCHENERILRDYPIQDEVWASRRWNLDRTDYEDLSG